MKNSWIVLLTLCTGLLFGASQSHAALIAHYTFDGGSLQNFANPGTHDLSAFGASPTFSGDSYVSDGSAANFLQATGLGTTSSYTVSMWIRTDSPLQGPNRALFSSQDSISTGSWQLEARNGTFRVMATDDSSSFQDFIFGAVSDDIWQHLVVVQDGTSLMFYIDGNLASSQSFTASDLGLFRLGINRATSRSFDGLMDNIRIYDDANQSIATLFNEGFGVTGGNGGNNEIPSPATISLLGAGLLSLAAIRRRRQS